MLIPLVDRDATLVEKLIVVVPAVKTEGSSFSVGATFTETSSLTV